MVKRLIPVRDKRPKASALSSARISNGVNKSCSYFPCHKGLENCTFCYCPFYPCLDRNFGRYLYSKKLKKSIWSCQDCNWIHKRETIDYIFSLIRENSSQPQAPSFKLKNNSRKLKVEETGIIILGHGSKLKKANNIIPEIVKKVKRRLGLSTIVSAYLQCCHPALPKSIKNLVSKGCGRIIIVPFFLLAGNHVSRDIPKAIKKEKARYPEVSFVYTKNLGEDVRIGEIVVERIKKAIARVYNY